MTVLRISGLSVTYPTGVVALENVSLDINKGEVVGLLGSNGAGKTTLLKTICGLVIPKQGVIEWKVEPKVGVLLEGSRAFYWNLTGWENAKYFATLKNVKDKNINHHLDYLFDLVGLWEVRHKVASSYSTGMKKRLSLLIALLGSPKLLLLDEPTVGLDSQGIIDLGNYLKIFSQEGISIIFATHDLSFAFSMSSKLFYINKGQLFNWECNTSYGIHTNLIVLLSGNPLMHFDYYSEYLIPIGENRWKLIGNTNDSFVFEILRLLVEQKGFRILQVFGVENNEMVVDSNKNRISASVDYSSALPR